MSVKDRLCQHYKSIGIDSTNAARFSSLVSKWEHDSGKEWTVNRLKSLADTLKYRIQNPSKPYAVPHGWSSRKTRSGRIIFSDGLLRRLFDLPLQGKHLKKVQSFTRSYQVISLDNESVSQMLKFRKGVETPFPETTESRSSINSIKTVFENDPMDIPYLKVTDKVEWTPPLSHMPSIDKTAPVLVRDPSQPLGVKLKKFSRKDYRSKSFIEVLSVDKDWNPIWKKYPQHVSKCIIGNNGFPYIKGRRISNIPAGVIGFIQEPGAKLRSVAMPLMCVQSLGAPLKDKLLTLCKRLTNIYVHDQSEGQLEIVNWLKDPNQGDVYSFDATAFTDRFPYELQLSLLKRLKKHGWADDFDIAVLDTVVQKSWDVGLNDSLKGLVKTKLEKKSPIPLDALFASVTWKVGQPMGFNPSFPIATLTHHYMMEALSKSLKLDLTEAQWVIVGDDIAIRNPELAEMYKVTMQNIGVSINMTKSVISPDYAEFCGKILTVNGISPSVKTKMVLHPDQLVDLIDFYGSEGLKHLTKREKRWAMKAILPVDLGGIGIKTQDMSWSEWINILDVDRIQKKRLLKLVKNFYNPTAREDIESTLDDISKFYRLTSIQLSIHAKVINVGVQPHEITSDWTELPVSVGFTNPGTNATQASNSNMSTFIDLLDNISRQLLRDDGNTLPDRSLFVIEERFGYELNRTEKPPKRPITVNQEIENEYDSKPKTARPRQQRSVERNFNKKGRARVLKGLKLKEKEKRNRPKGTEPQP